jgi:hypothetical protein
MNPIKGEVPLKLSDGREFVLVLDIEALVEAEAAYGKPVAQVMADASAGFIGASRALLYGSLRARHPSITLREASAIMVDGEHVLDALSAAAEAAMPSDASTEGNAARPKPSPRGKSSGRSGAKQA